MVNIDLPRSLPRWMLLQQAVRRVRHRGVERINDDCRGKVDGLWRRGRKVLCYVAHSMVVMPVIISALACCNGFPSSWFRVLACLLAGSCVPRCSAPFLPSRQLAQHDRHRFRIGPCLIQTLVRDAATASLHTATTSDVGKAGRACLGTVSVACNSCLKHVQDPTATVSEGVLSDVASMSFVRPQEEIERRTEALWHGAVIPSARARVRVASARRHEGTKNMRVCGKSRLSPLLKVPLSICANATESQW